MATTGKEPERIGMNKHCLVPALGSIRQHYGAEACALHTRAHLTHAVNVVSDQESKGHPAEYILPTYPRNKFTKASLYHLYNPYLSWWLSKRNFPAYMMHNYMVQSGYKPAKYGVLDYVLLRN